MPASLVNRTRVAAQLHRMVPPGAQQLPVHMLTAKATYVVNEAGALILDPHEPVPILTSDYPMALGILPRDDLPRPTPQFQVICLAQAHSVRPVTTMRVALSVGGHRRELMVHGDRVWVDAALHVACHPLPFTTMPITFERCFGGSQIVKVDDHASMLVAWPGNPMGRGFDPLELVTTISRSLRAPGHYPQAEGWRYLPNLEDPNEPVSRSDAAPLPVAWSALPMGMILHPRHDERIVDEEGRLEMPAGAFIRAHPHWLMPVPDFPLPIEVQGLTAAGYERWWLPALHLVADVQNPAGTWHIPMVPMMLQILVEERKVVVILRSEWASSQREQAVRLREVVPDLNREVHRPCIESQARP